MLIVLAVQLHERLYYLSPLSIVTGRLCLPVIVFFLTSLTTITAEPGSDLIIHAYHALYPSRQHRLPRSIYLRLVVQLKQPFGALLLASQERVLHRRACRDGQFYQRRRWNNKVVIIYAGSGRGFLLAFACCVRYSFVSPLAPSSNIILS